jgi:SAM-dependent methyltransferase
MGKQGEIHYLRNIGESGLCHAVNKPFSDPNCHLYLTDLGAILALLPPPPARLLDLGCGTGWTSAFFARRGYEVVGVDICADMIAQANQLRERAALPSLRFVECDYEEMAFREEFDAAVFFDALHHAVDESLALRRAFRSLKPGGRCVTREPGEGHAQAATSVEAVAKYGVTEKDMPPAKIIALGRAAGFRRFYAFPLAWCNFLIDYQLHETKQASEDADLGIGSNNPLAGAGWFKRLFHAVVRWRFHLSSAEYGGLLTRLLPLARTHWQLHSSHGLSSSGLVVLVK